MPELLRKSFAKKDVYQRYLRYIDKIERLTQITPDDELIDSLDAAYLVLPLIESVANDILNCSARSYLIKLDYTRDEAHLLMTIFRNGLLHNTHLRRLVFEDGTEVSWAMSADGGTGPWMPYHPGEKDPETGEWWFKPEKPFKYFKQSYEGGEMYTADLGVTRLAAQIRYDLQHRLENDDREYIEIVTGEKIPMKRPHAKSYSEYEGVY